MLFQELTCICRRLECLSYCPNLLAHAETRNVTQGLHIMCVEELITSRATKMHKVQVQVQRLYNRQRWWQQRHDQCWQQAQVFWHHSDSHWLRDLSERTDHLYGASDLIIFGEAKPWPVKAHDFSKSPGCASASVDTQATKVSTSVAFKKTLAVVESLYSIGDGTTIA